MLHGKNSIKLFGCILLFIGIMSFHIIQKYIKDIFQEYPVFKIFLFLIFLNN
mgnify:CR=1 FL=1|jgi:hypothetical protein